jgi:putative phosphoribosyl transferase
MKDPVVLAFTPGGVRVASEIATALSAPLDYIAARRVRIPGLRHSQVGAATPDAVVLDREQMNALQVPDAYVEMLIERERSELWWATKQARGKLPPIDLAKRVVIVVDDGMADTLEAEAVINSARQAGAARLVYATPGCLPEFARVVGRRVEDFVVLTAPSDRRAFLISDERFAQTTTAEVRRLLEECRSCDPAWRSASPGALAGKS